MAVKMGIMSSKLAIELKRLNPKRMLMESVAFELFPARRGKLEY